MPHTSLIYSQEGTTANEIISSAVMTSDENIVLSGVTWGDFDGMQIGSYDAAAVKLDADGKELWRYQVEIVTLDVSFQE